MTDPVKPFLPILCLAALVALIACHPPMSFTPEQLDALYGACTAHLDDAGARAVTPSDILGIRTPGEPPGTPVVMYGASWCGVCHLAAQYMTRRGIPFVEKDVEKDPSAQQALEATLASAKFEPKPQHLLPVIDVRGTVTIGFSPCVVERAWAAP